MAKKCKKCREPATAGRKVVESQEQSLCLRCAGVESVEIPPSLERKMSAPELLTVGPAEKMAHGPDGGDLWRHQALAFEALAKGENLVVATATASGKSRIFQGWTLHLTGDDEEATALIFYPVKALSNDQMDKWQEAAEGTPGMSAKDVAQINGDMRNMAERERAIGESKIVVMTPDVCQAWLTRKTNQPQVRKFLRGLRVIVLDEAHIYEDVFGSNASYLFRRVISLAKMVGNPAVPQVIGATATIEDPAGHMKLLTGLEYTVIGDEENGTPRQMRTLVHLADDGRRGSVEDNAAKVISEIIDNDPEAQVIAFYDSRQGVERICRKIGRPTEVVPYRSGYLSGDRRNVEKKLHQNRIRAIVATSALELGIDMPDLSHGVNVGLPQNRKQLHQRMGRVGRTKPGTFVILAPKNQFTQFGDTLENYYRESVEPSALYLGNEQIGFQHAQCLKQELEDNRSDSLVPPKTVAWPDGFESSLKYAHGMAPPHLRKTMTKKGGLPHLEYGLRNVGEENLDILEEGQARESKGIGNINMNSALREAYPGGIYMHQASPYRVEQWARRPDDRSAFIRVLKVNLKEGRTWPILRRTATVTLDDDHIAAGRIREKRNGLMAQVRVMVTESVEGYLDPEKQPWYYRDLQKADGRKTRKQREFPTTGVYMEINNPWFQGESGEGWKARTQLAYALRRYLIYRKSIAPGNLGVTVENLFVSQGDGYVMTDRGVLIYDNIHGGLGMTDDLYLNLKLYAENLVRAAKPEDEQDEDDGGISPWVAAEFLQWVREEDVLSDMGYQPEYGERHWWRIVRPGSRVKVFSKEKNAMLEGTVGRMVWQDRQTFHQIGVKGEDQVLATEAQIMSGGNLYEWQLWQPESGLLQNLSDTEG